LTTAAAFLEPTFHRLAVAMLLGAVIGLERQWRRKSTGIRTNALVCFGATAFVDLAWTIGGPNEIARVVSYVVSGVGFIGAGAIIKDVQGGIRGLNTAATLWCTAAVGACAGAGEVIDAAYATLFLIVINVVLGPVGRWVDARRPAAPAPADSEDGE